MLFCLFFSVNYCFAAVVLIATNKVEYIVRHNASKAPCTRYNMLSNRVCIHDTPIVKPIWQPAVSCIQPVVKTVVQPGLHNRLYRVNGLNKFELWRLRRGWHHWDYQANLWCQKNLELLQAAMRRWLRDDRCSSFNIGLTPARNRQTTSVSVSRSIVAVLCDAR